MEQNTPINTAAPAINNKPKTGKGLVAITIAASVLAVCGICFGAWAFLDGNTQKTNLNKQISDLKAANVQLLEQVEAANNTETNDDEDSTLTDAEDYIIVSEWGLKIKKPANWKNSVRIYSFYNGYPQAADTLEIRESSERGAGVMVGVGGESCESQVAAETNTCFEIDGQVVIVSELRGELAPGEDSTASAEFLEHFNDFDNYSAL
jgi:hypothetical protein